MPVVLSIAWHLMGAQPLRVLAPALLPALPVTLSESFLSASDSPPPPCCPAGGVLYVATVKNYLGTEPIISRAVGRAEDWIRTETLPSWLNGGERAEGGWCCSGDRVGGGWVVAPGYVCGI